MEEARNAAAMGRLVPLPGETMDNCAVQLGTTSKTVGSSMAQLLTAAAQVVFVSWRSLLQLFWPFSDGFQVWRAFENVKVTIILALLCPRVLWVIVLCDLGIHIY